MDFRFWIGGQRLQNPKSKILTQASAAETAIAFSADWTVCLWEVTTGQIRHVLDKHEGIVGAVAVGSDSQRIVTGNHDQLVRLWDTGSGQLRWTLLLALGAVATV